MTQSSEDIAKDQALDEKIRQHALANAFTHNGKAQPKAVLSKVLAEMPQYRQRGKEVAFLVNRITEEVNSLSVANQRGILEDRWPELLQEKTVKVEEKKLAPLPNIKKYSEVVTRFSPNPDSVLHMGSARAIVLSYEYAKMYGGQFILRFEDTDPRTKKPVPAFYDSIREDLKWLGCVPNQEFTQSNRIPIYYDYTRRLIATRGAYVCTCKPEDFRQRIQSMTACPCRILSVEDHLVRWEKMLDGSFLEGEAVVRIRTDLNHPNPAVRDWPAMRILDQEKYPHPRLGKKYRVWPLYNLSTGLDDHLMKISHIIRGKEHLTNEARQRFMYAHLGWEYPDAIHYGRLKITGAVLSKSKIKLGVEVGTFKGYDDPRLATFAALKRRGIRPEAVKKMMIDIGTNTNDITLSWETLYTYNRRLVDAIAPRYSFVSKPIRVEVGGVADPRTISLHLHPDHPEWGSRKIDINSINGKVKLLASFRDRKLLLVNHYVRFMGLFNVLIINSDGKHVTAEYHSDTYEDAKKLQAPLINFAVDGTGIPTRIIMPNARTIEGFAEQACKSLKVGDVIQFERFGFVRIDKQGPPLRAFFSHK